MYFNDELNERAKKVETLLEGVLDIDAGKANDLLTAMRYSALTPGKRLRPILMEETSVLFLGDAPELPEFMAAIELIHSYSLVHDDMPCIDNDEYRRGRITTHAVFGEDTALLAGDGLLNYAYEVAISSFKHTKDPIKCAKALKVLSKKAGIFGMVGGQALDVKSEKTNRLLTKEDLLFIHKNKTAALIEASMMIGGILAGATDEEVKKLEEAATKIGIAFQIRDDILDVEGSFEELGKDIGSDEENGKETYVTLFGMDKAKADVEKYSEDALNIIRSFTVKNPFLEELVENLVNRNK